MSESLREKSNKRICFITTISVTLSSFILPFAEYLHEHTSYDLTFICDNDDEFAASLPEYIHYIPVKMKRGISLGGVGAMFKMIRIFRREKFDMVQYSTPNASLYSAIAAWIARVNVRLYCQWGMAYVGFSGFKRKIFKCIEKLICRLSTQIEPDSFGNLKFSHTERLYTRNKSSVIWNGSACGVDLQKFDITKKIIWREKIRSYYSIPNDAIVLGFVGRITRDKGINELLAAFKMFLNHNHEAYLMIVGSEEITSAVDEKLYLWAQESPSVIFCGKTDVVEQYLSAMDIYVLPSYREGFGMVVVEAEAMGIPVIVTDIPGPTDAMIPEITGLVVKRADIDSLYEAIQKLSTSNSLRTEFGIAAHNLVVSKFERETLFDYILKDRKHLLENSK